MRRKLITLATFSALSSNAYSAEQPHTQQKDETDIEKVVITANPLQQSILQSATPVSILSGDELRQKNQATLGDTLKNEAGVHSSYFGPVSSSPIIRGLDGPRIKVLQNGLDVSDASRTGGDHQVATDTANATQIEILRGPATLLYGSGAIGGVVNVVDNRLPREAREVTEGAVAYRHNTGSNENLLNATLDGGTGKWAWHVDAFTRNTKNVEIPETLLHEEDEAPHDEIENSFIDAQGFTLGTGWIDTNFNIALGYSNLSSDYGLPAHDDAHGHADEHDAGGENNHDDVHEEEEHFASLEQDRWQALIDWRNLRGPFTEVHWHSAYSDYAHSEIEEGIAATIISNKTFESRLWAKHTLLSGWDNVTGINLVTSDYDAQGEEAFTPPSKTDSWALFTLHEKPVGNWLWKLGGRYEQVSIDPGAIENLAHGGEHDVTHQQEASETFATQRFDLLSLSAGWVYQIDNNQSIAMNWTHAQRAPSSTEIFANGPHIGTGTFEVGAAYEVHAEHDHVEIEPGDEEVVKEVSNNLDLTYRFGGEYFQGSVSLFYNQFEDYLFQENTGLTFGELEAHDEFEEDHEEGHEDGHEEHNEGLPIYLFKQQDARLYGFEAEIDVHFSDSLRMEMFTDLIRARLKDGENLPRIPPMRMGSSLHWEEDNWHVEGGFTYHQRQDNIAGFETETPGYTMVNLAVNYYTTWQQNDVHLFLNAHNLTDELAFVHSSFIKDDAPLPGRNLELGVRFQF